MNTTTIARLFSKKNRTIMLDALGIIFGLVLIIAPTVIVVQIDANDRARSYCVGNGGTWGGNSVRCTYPGE